MTFGGALEALKCGARVARVGWNGKGMWIALTLGSEVHRATTSGAAAQLANEEPGRDYITIGAHIDMRTADGTMVIGWLASQTDMLADDWILVA
jgi:hypothetical protein